MRSKTVLLLLCLVGMFSRGASAAPVATIVEGESSLVRDANRVALAEGTRLANDDLVDTTAQTKLLRIEFDDGLMLLVAPESRLCHIRKGPAVSREPSFLHAVTRDYFRWFERCLFISNIVQRSLPNTLRSLSSAMISRLFCGFCRLFLRM